MRRTLAVMIATAAVLLPAPSAAAASPDVVINEVYGGGGNTSAIYRNDFVELYNKSAVSVSLTGWSIQYASATGSSWSVTTLSGSIAPGGHYLVQLASGGAVGATLPTPDRTGTTNMSATSGKVALRTTTTALTCSTGCAFASGNRDFVGYGSASSSEGSTAPSGSNTKSVARKTAGVDSDSNSTDFAAATPTPSNSSASTDPCAGYPSTRIRAIQGSAHTSPLSGSQSTRGVVTAVATNGFWIQDPCPDASVSTSEGLFVFTSTTAPTVVAGDEVNVTGTVSEFRAGGTTSANLTLTQLTSPTVTKIGTRALPAATVVGTGGRVPPASVIDNDATGNVETSGSFDATTDGIDFWESLEGMRVQVAGAVATGPRSTFGEIPVIPGGSGTRTNRGGIVISSSDFNPERVLVDDRLATTPTVNVGDSFSGALVGVIDYSFGNFKLLPSAFPTVVSAGLAAETTAAAGAGQLAVGTFNVENLAPGDPQTKYDALAAAIVSNLAAPDLIALEEVQDNDGAANSTVVAADQTMSKLINAISAVGGPAYSYRQINPTDDADGGQPGGNIRNVFLFRTDRGLSFTDRVGGTATADSTVSNVAGKPRLLYSPGRIKPTNTAFNASRKPLAGEFRWNGRTVFVVANHFNSKGGDDPLFGRFQPPTRSSETQRHQQATIVNTFVDQVRAIDPDAAIIVLGDINDFDFSTTADLLVGSGELVDLPRTLPLQERYTYVFEGNAQVLDHILLSSWLAGVPYAYDVVHVNSEFATQVSDHEPQVVKLTF